MPEDREERQGEYAIWQWNSVRKCWEYTTSCCIYPIKDEFVVSSCDVWHDGVFSTFEAAEREALDMNTPDKEPS